MGVKDLWVILSPISEKKSLWTLQNETVAIDLSVWICENHQVNTDSNNLYLRNLFFRTSYLLLLGVKPIFVLEGEAPELKYKKIKERQQERSKLKSNMPNSFVRSGKRTRLESLQKQCEELLKCMGIKCLYSAGEAEALCAELNNRGIVKGVITKDSDCFLYGARTVYRNFNISSNGGSFEEYKMSSIEKKLSLGRNKLIALSLFCGCDYNANGIEGIGKESALKYLSSVSDSEVLSKLSEWREHSDDVSLTKLEKNLRQKSVQHPDFPFHDIQNEFLCRNYDVSQISFSWTQPSLRDFVLLTNRKLDWNADYAIEKFLPLLSRWHLLNDKVGNVLQLDYIVKKRNLRNILSYEVKWKDFDSTTIEPISYLKKTYENAIIEFEDKKKTKTKKGKKINTCALPENIDRLVDDLNNLSFDAKDDPSVKNKIMLNDESISVSDFECSASDLLELSFIVESIVSRN